MGKRAKINRTLNLAAAQCCAESRAVLHCTGKLGPDSCSATQRICRLENIKSERGNEGTPKRQSGSLRRCKLTAPPLFSFFPLTFLFFFAFCSSTFWVVCEKWGLLDLRGRGLKYGTRYRHPSRLFLRKLPSWNVEIAHSSKNGRTYFRLMYFFRGHCEHTSVACAHVRLFACMQTRAHLNFLSKTQKFGR